MKKDTDKRQILAKVIRKYEKIKPFLTDDQKYSLDYEIRIAKFELNRPDTRYYLDEHLQPVKGIMKSPWCKLCQKNLDEMRENNPRCRVIDFCCPNHRKEHNRRKKIRETELEITEPLWWNHPKDEKGNPLPLRRKDMFYFTRNGSQLVRHSYKAKKDMSYS